MNWLKYTAFTPNRIGFGSVHNNIARQLASLKYGKNKSKTLAKMPYQ